MNREPDVRHGCTVQFQPTPDFYCGDPQGHHTTRQNYRRSVDHWTGLLCHRHLFDVHRMSPPRVAILDYGCGNLGSVVNAVRKAGGDPIVVHSSADFGEPTHLILPGQGAFDPAMAHLASEELDFWHHLHDQLPILGICLGMQLMCEGSEEAPGVKGLGWLPFMVERLRAPRLPHIGWNTVHGMGQEHDYYFCHSYAVRTFRSGYPAWGTTFYNNEGFAASFHQDNLWAVQFHPEKSGKAGLDLLREFLGL